MGGVEGGIYYCMCTLSECLTCSAARTRTLLPWGLLPWRQLN